MQFQLENKWVELQGEGKGVAEQVAFQSLFGKPYHMIEGLLLCTELQISHSKPLGSERDVLSDQHPPPPQNQKPFGWVFINF